MLSFGAVSSSGRPFLHGGYARRGEDQGCLAARFARNCSRLIAIRWRTVALAANSACRINFGKSIARRSATRCAHIHQSRTDLARAERPYEDKALPLGIVDKRLLVRELSHRHPS